MDKNPRIADIEKMQADLRKSAEEMRKDSHPDLHNFLNLLANLLETDKLFSSPTLLETYLRIIKNTIKDTEIEVNGIKWPVDIFITSKSYPFGWNRADISLNQIFARGKEKFRVIGIADEPTVIVEHIETGRHEHHVISSRNFSEFRKID